MGHTDMNGHNAMVKDLQTAFKMNADLFSLPSSESTITTEEINFFGNPDMKDLLLNTVLHSADISNPCREWEVSQMWGMAVIEECFNQGDKEKGLGIPVRFLNDRDTQS